MQIYENNEISNVYISKMAIYVSQVTKGISTKLDDRDCEIL